MIIAQATTSKSNAITVSQQHYWHLFMEQKNYYLKERRTQDCVNMDAVKRLET